MAIIMTNRSFNDPALPSNPPQLGTQVLASLAGILDEDAYFEFSAKFVFILRL